MESSAVDILRSTTCCNIARNSNLLMCSPNSFYGTSITRRKGMLNGVLLKQKHDCGDRCCLIEDCLTDSVLFWNESHDVEFIGLSEHRTFRDLNWPTWPKTSRLPLRSKAMSCDSKSSTEPAKRPVSGSTSYQGFWLSRVEQSPGSSGRREKSQGHRLRWWWCQSPAMCTSGCWHVQKQEGIWSSGFQLMNNSHPLFRRVACDDLRWHGSAHDDKHQVFDDFGWDRFSRFIFSRFLHPTPKRKKNITCFSAELETVTHFPTINLQNFLKRKRACPSCNFGPEEKKEEKKGTPK